MIVKDNSSLLELTNESAIPLACSNRSIVEDNLRRSYQVYNWITSDIFSATATSIRDMVVLSSEPTLQWLQIYPKYMDFIYTLDILNNQDIPIKSESRKIVAGKITEKRKAIFKTAFIDDLSIGFR